MTRFVEGVHYVVDEDTGCWIWGRARFSSGGYGAVTIGGRTLRAHRVAYEDAKGRIPAGLHVLHSCDRPPCVNPDHLRVGTNAENIQDRVERGRRTYPRAADHPCARLTWDDVHDIRARYDAGERAVDIANDYPVKAQQIGKIGRRTVWQT